MSPIQWRQRLHRWWRDAKEQLRPRYKIRVLEGELPPAALAEREIVLLQESGEDWSVAFACPCGCGDMIELALIREAKPRWTLSNGEKGVPSLSPSVWRRTGCRSHFWLRRGRIVWC